MRKAIYLIIAALFTISFIACKKEESFEIGSNPPPGTNNPGNNVTGVIRMKINGVQWVADKVAGASVLSGIINITGISKDGKTITVTLNDTIAKTYVLDQSSNSGAALSDSASFNGVSFTSNQGADSLDAGGTVTVTSIDKANKTVSGTFKFNLFRDIDGRQVKITEGVFDKLGYRTTLPSANTTDTFRVKIDNVDWTAKSITPISANGMLVINATELNASKTVGIFMPAGVTPGSYDFDGVEYIGLYNPSATSALVSDTGKLNIIELNTTTKRIRGNFNFKATELIGTKSAQLSQGYFSIRYQ